MGPDPTHLHVRSFEPPDEVTDTGWVRSEVVSIGGIRVARDTHAPGFRWSTHIRPLVGTESCRVRHVGIAIQGSLHVHLDDGTDYLVRRGEVFHIPPGHDAWVEGPEPFVSVEWMGVGIWATPLGALTERVLCSILFTDIVDSTVRAGELGDRVWGDTLRLHEAQVRESLERYRGREIKQTGDGVLAIFDSAARAARCALEIRDSAARLGIPIRASVHTGEVEYSDRDILGVAVHEASRILGLAGTGEVLTSATTRSLVTDPGLRFEDRGEHEMKGFAGMRRVYLVEE